MRKTLIAPILAAALVLTSLPTAPARANDDLAKIIAAGTVLFILGKAIQQEQKSTKYVYKQQVKPAPQKKVYRHAPKPVHKKRVHAPRRAALPGYCMTRIHTWDGPRRLLSGRCVYQNYRNAHALPRACVRSYETRHGLRRGFSPACLNERGYRIASAR